MKLTTQARTAWNEISLEYRDDILNNVWCASCSASTRIINITGEMVESALVLHGKCDVCGGKVTRVIEGDG